jgi:hypothetical protein
LRSNRDRVPGNGAKELARTSIVTPTGFDKGANMAKINLLAVLAAICAFALQADEDNPYVKAKVGDWIEYTASLQMPHRNLATSIHKEVVKKTATEVTLEISTLITMAGTDESAAKMTSPRKQTLVIRLNKKFTPGMPQGLDPDVTAKESGSGTETLAVGGKNVETNWVAFEWGSAKDQMASGKAKAWLGKNIPLDGVVKLVTEVPQCTSTMELKDFGFGK